jgi:hypothetical protein
MKEAWTKIHKNQKLAPNDLDNILIQHIRAIKTTKEDKKAKQFYYDWFKNYVEHGLEKGYNVRPYLFMYVMHNGTTNSQMYVLNKVMNGELRL